MPISRRTLAPLVAAGLAAALLAAPPPSVAAPGDLGPQVRVSRVLPDATALSAFQSDVAYNEKAKAYLAVWVQPHAGTPADYEVYARRLAPGGQPLGEPFRISEMGPEGATATPALRPAVAANPITGQWYVTWEADDQGAAQVDGESEIFGQLVGSDGVPVGTDIRLSSLGPSLDPAYDAVNPDVAAHPVTGEWLVAWSGDDSAADIVDDEFEIFVQRLSPSGSQVGTNDQRISWMGDDADAGTGDARNPSVAVNPVTGEWLVAWQSSDKQPGLAATKNEIYTQRLTANGTLTGARSRITTTGDDAVPGASAWGPDVVAHPRTGQWWVTYYASPTEGALAPEEYEVYLQRLTATGAQTGADDQRVSVTGADGDDRTGAYSPRIAVDRSSGEVAIVWYAAPLTGGLVDQEYEVFAQRFGPDAARRGITGQRLSFTGPDGTAERGTGEEPAVAADPRTQQFFVIWESQPGEAPYAAGEGEVFGRSISTKDVAVTGAKVQGRKAQRQGRKVTVAFRMAATAETLRVRVTGKVRTPTKGHRLKARSLTVAKSATGRVRLVLARTSSNRAVLRAVRAWRRAPKSQKKRLAVKALVRFTLRDAAGNTLVVRRTVRLT